MYDDDMKIFTIPYRFIRVNFFYFMVMNVFCHNNMKTKIKTHENDFC